MSKLKFQNLRKKALRKIPFSAESGYVYVHSGLEKQWYHRCDLVTGVLDWLSPLLLIIAALFALCALIFHFVVLVIMAGLCLAISLFLMAFLLWIDKQVQIVSNFTYYR